MSHYVNDHFESDLFTHELLLVVEEENGIVVVIGCGHLGILNFIDAAMVRFPGKPVKAVVGGFHLIDTPYLYTMGVNPDEVHFIARKLVSLGCPRVITGHCTGRKAVRILNTELGGRMEILYSSYSTKI